MSDRRFLLDTNILSQLVRQPQGVVARHIARVGEAAVCTSVVVAAELRFGAARRQHARLTAQVQAVLAAIPVLALDAPADQCYARLRAELERTGKSIGPNDLLIAAHALAEGCTLVTDNESEFRRVAGLDVVNWLSV